MTPQPPTLKTTEIFPSVQGEGSRQGLPTIFIRLAGCRLRCDFCDTRYAWEDGQVQTVEEITAAVRKIHRSYPAGWVCLTGGEPFDQDIRPLAASLKSLGLKIQVETNALRFDELPVDWYTVSPKPPDYAFHRQYLQKAHEVKLVVTRDLELPVIQRLRSSFPEKTPLWLQPQSSMKWSREKAGKLLQESLKTGLTSIRLGIQLHKVYGLK